MSKKMFLGLAFMFSFVIGILFALNNGLPLSRALANSLIFGIIVVYIALVSLWGVSIASDKGYSEWLGFLLGLFLNLLGIVVLLILPRRKAQKSAGKMDQKSI